MKKHIIFSALFFLMFVSALEAQQISQWRGADRSGVYPAKGLLKTWPEEGPELIWKTDDLGKGHSSVSLEGDHLFITGLKDTIEYITALDDQGNRIWQVPYGRGWMESFPDSRCTPTVFGNRIYVTSGKGEVVCLDAANGDIIWSVDAFSIYEGACGIWGVAESPLLIDNKVIFTTAGHMTNMIALDKDSGDLIWKSETLHDTLAYVSPILIQHNGNDLIVGVTSSYIFCVDPVDGNIVSKIRYFDIETPVWHPNAPVINCISPLYQDGRLYVTSGYNHVGAMFELSSDASQMNLIWTDTTLDTHHGGVVKLENYIYGSNWIDNGNGNWCCIDWQTGEPKYDKKWKTKGSVVAADGMLYCYEERTGNLALVQPDPEDFKIVSSFRIKEGAGPHWSHPVIHNGRMYVRHGEVLMAFNVKE